MFHMKRITFIVCFLVAFIIQSDQKISLFAKSFAKIEPNCEYKISVDKNEYFMGEAILVNIKIINHDDVGPRITYDIIESFIVKDQYGVRYPSKIKFSIDYSAVTPMGNGEIYNGEINITESFADYSTGTRRVYPPGELSLQGVILQPGYPRLTSNKIIIDIIEPVDNAKIVYNEMMSIYKIVHQQGNYELGSQKYLDLYNQYPNCVYADMLLHKSMRTGGDKVEKGELLLKRFPNSYYTKHALKDIKRIFKLKKEFDRGLNYFQSILDTSQNQNLQIQAKKQIQELDRAFKKRLKESNKIK